MGLHRDNDITGKPLTEHQANEACAKLLGVIGGSVPADARDFTIGSQFDAQIRDARVSMGTLRREDIVKDVEGGLKIDMFELRTRAAEHEKAVAEGKGFG